MTRYGFLTVRAHPTEPQVFEDMFTLLLPIFHKMKTFTYCIEDDGTPSRHLHCFFNLPSSIIDKQKIIQKLETKCIKAFLKSLKDRQTIYNSKWDSHFNQVKLVPDTEEDKLKTLGYCLKNNCERFKSFHDSELLRQSLEFYMADHRNKTTQSKNNWKIITCKNFHFSLEEYSSSKNMTVFDPMLIPKMTHDKHSFQIRDKDLKKYLSELRFSHQEYNENCSELSDIKTFDKEQEELDIWEYAKYLQHKLQEADIPYKGYFDKNDKSL